MVVQQKVKTRVKHKCPPHHFIINSDNVGHCRYCPAVKDFGKLLQREGVFVTMGRRGAKARKDILSKRSAAAKKLWQNPEFRARRGAAAKERWQDREYRAKQNAAHASLPGRHNKKEALV